jgi:hypothetical protein
MIDLFEDEVRARSIGWRVKGSKWVLGIETVAKTGKHRLEGR